MASSSQQPAAKTPSESLEIMTSSSEQPAAKTPSETVATLEEVLTEVFSWQRLVRRERHSDHITALKAVLTGNNFDEPMTAEDIQEIFESIIPDVFDHFIPMVGDPNLSGATLDKTFACLKPDLDEIPGEQARAIYDECFTRATRTKRYIYNAPRIFFVNDFRAPFDRLVSRFGSPQALSTAYVDGELGFDIWMLKSIAAINEETGTLFLKYPGSPRSQGKISSTVAGECRGVLRNGNRLETKKVRPGEAGICRKIFYDNDARGNLTTMWFEVAHMQTDPEGNLALGCTARTYLPKDPKQLFLHLETYFRGLPHLKHVGVLYRYFETGLEEYFLPRNTS